MLLIEPDASLRRLIVLGLQHRGVQVVEASSLDSLAEQPIADPDLLVLDIDRGWRDDKALLLAIEDHPYLSHLPRVVLAWDSTRAASSSTFPLLECLSKPFDARQLYAVIEKLLLASTTGGLSSVPAVPISSSFMVAPSLSPLIAAAGLLLTIVGLMLQLFLAGIGLLVVLAALLWWTLGKPPERQILTGDLRNYTPSLHS